MGVLEAIYQAVQGLPLHDRLQLVERIVHEAVQSTVKPDTSTAAPQRGMGFYADRGFSVPDDFDEPLPPDIQRALEGEDDER
jgi:hypothetical protein